VTFPIGLGLTAKLGLLTPLYIAPPVAAPVAQVATIVVPAPVSPVPGPLSAPVVTPPSAGTTPPGITPTVVTPPVDAFPPNAVCDVTFPPSTQTNPVNGTVGTYDIAYQGFCTTAQGYAASVPGSVVTVVG
jgi:hypothetical protein